MKEENLDPDKINPNTFEFLEAKRKIPEYNKFSIEKQKEIKSISDTIIYTRFLINGIKEINTNYKKDKSVVKDFPAFGLMQRAFYYQAILEINKLFDIRESLCICKFINGLINNYRRIIWFENLDKESLITINKSIKEKNKYFDEIRNLRDKHLAHSDKNRKKVVIELKALIILQEIAESIINKIGNALYGTSTAFEQKDGSGLELMFNKLTAFDQLRDMVNEANKNIEDDIRTDKLLEIVRFKSIK